MAYISIDTCSWLELISENEINPQIGTLKYWIDSESIQVLVPEKVKEEWYEKKNKVKKNLQDSLRQKYKSSQELIGVIKRTTNSDPGSLDLDLVFIDQQIDEIESLILRSKHQLETSNDIKLFVYERSTKKPYKAPFHNNQMSMKDADIYFSSLEYCAKNVISEIYFISDNAKEFGHPLEDAPSKGSSTRIHAHLIEDFPQVSVKYFSKIGQAISFLESRLPTLPQKENPVAGLVQGSFYLIKNSTLSIVDTLDVLFKKIYNELNFLPTKILSKIPPFKNGDEVAYYNAFTLVISNESLFNFLEQALLKERTNNSDFTDPEKNKVDYILQRLTQNLIFNFNLRKSNRKINTYYCPILSGNSIEDYYNKFDFEKISESLKKFPKVSLEEKVAYAYVLYQTGNYLKAKDLYCEIADESKNVGKDILYFIAQYNLSKLASFIKNFYWRDETQNIEQVVDELKKIDLRKIANNLNSRQSNKFFDFIIQEEFFTDASQQVHEVVTKIIDQYFSNLNGGTSYNGYVSELTCAFAELDYMLNENHVIHDCFSEFANLFQRVIEGLFASHAISGKHDSRLEAFDDYWLSKLIYYGKREDIVKFFHRYKLRELEYRPSKMGATLSTN
jgi:hypothetical protein